METYYSAKERRAQILQLLKSRPKILVSSLSQMFNISEVTIRKDLEELENRNLLIRVRGGAIRLPKLNIAEEQATTEKKISLSRKTKYRAHGGYTDTRKRNHHSRFGQYNDGNCQEPALVQTINHHYKCHRHSHRIK